MKASDILIAPDNWTLEQVDAFDRALDNREQLGIPTRILPDGFRRIPLAEGTIVFSVPLFGRRITLTVAKETK